MLCVGKPTLRNCGAAVAIDVAGPAHREPEPFGIEIAVERVEDRAVPTGPDLRAAAVVVPAVLQIAPRRDASELHSPLLLHSLF